MRDDSEWLAGALDITRELASLVWHEYSSDMSAGWLVLRRDKKHAKAVYNGWLRGDYELADWIAPEIARQAEMAHA